MHGLIFETSVCYWQNQPGCYLSESRHCIFEDAIEVNQGTMGARRPHHTFVWVVLLTHPWQALDMNQKEVSFVNPDLGFP